MFNFVKRNISMCKHIKRSCCFFKQFLKYKKIIGDGRFPCQWQDIHACLSDMTVSTGFDAHYLYHTAWAARILQKIRPVTHIDIGSCLRFISQVSAFIPIEFYDYRPANLNLSNVVSRSADITALPFLSSSVKSISCMHVVEHIGLGRYGDPIDPHGDIKAMQELSRVLAVNGNLLFVVPVGEARIAFNAHRIYSCEQIIQAFSTLELASFSFVGDDGFFYKNGNFAKANSQRYGCGCFLFHKNEQG